MPSKKVWPRALAVSTLLALAALPLLAGCGGSAAPNAKGTTASSPAGSTASAPATPALTDVALRLPWLSSGPDAPFYYAVAKGWYKAVGLNVTIEPGKSSLLTAETVASGKDTFGFADATAVAGVVGDGGKIKVVAQVIDSSPVGIIHRPSVVLKTPQDLAGKTILTNSAGGPVIAMLHAALASGHVPVSSVHLDIVAPSAEASSFASHADYLLTGFCNSTFPATNKLVPSSICTPDTQLAPSVRALSYGLVTTDQELQAHPDVVRKFVAASVKAWQFAIANPDQILAPSLQTAQTLDQHPPTQQIWKLGFTETLAGLNQPKGKPFGYSEQATWEAMLAVLHQYAGLKQVLPAADYYSNAYLPQSGA